MQLGASFTATGGGLVGTQADLQATARYARAPIKSVCAQGMKPVVQVRAQLRDTVTHASATLFVGPRALADGELSASTPLAEWIEAGGIESLPRNALKIQLRKVRFENLPWFCERIAGQVAGSIEGNDLFSTRTVHPGATH